MERNPGEIALFIAKYRVLPIRIDVHRSTKFYIGWFRGKSDHSAKFARDTVNRDVEKFRLSDTTRFDARGGDFLKCRE